MSKCKFHFDNHTVWNKSLRMTISVLAFEYRNGFVPMAAARPPNSSMVFSIDDEATPTRGIAVLCWTCGKYII